jgi:hypothetical protein
MKQLIEDLISALEYHAEQTRPIHSTTVAIQAAREAVKTMPAQPAVQEPVGYTDANGRGWAVKWSGALPPNLTLFATPPAQPAPPVQDEFPLRGILASELKCWHRLTEDEQINLLAFVKNTRPAAQLKPLKVEAIRKLMPKPDSKGWIYTECQVIETVRQVEAAHKITEKGGSS